MNNYFEEIKANLVADSSRSRKELHSILKDMGYISEDDFYFCVREDVIMPWQTDTLITLDIKRDNFAIYETEEDIEEGISTNWNMIIVSYLMATMPLENIGKLVDKIEELLDKLGLALIYEGSETTIKSFSEKLNLISEELATNYAEVGSETLALLIEENYS